MNTNSDPTALLLDHNNPSLNNKYDSNNTGNAEGNNYNKNDKIIIKLRPIGQTALNGLSSSYDPSFPAELEGIVPKHIFERDIERFNHRLTDYWPCPCCFGFGYACCICTLGMSWYFPSMCVASAEKFAVQYFDEQANSRSEYFDIKLKFKLKRRCCNSWVEVSFIPPPSNTTGEYYDYGNSKGGD
jgi:hypothetical protein